MATKKKPVSSLPQPEQRTTPTPPAPSMPAAAPQPGSTGDPEALRAAMARMQTTGAASLAPQRPGTPMPGGMPNIINAPPVITEEKVHDAEALLMKYKQAKANLEARIVENEEWYKRRHWDYLRAKDKKKSGDPEPTSAWTLNVLMGKHADAMDNYPTINVLPREMNDEQDAELLSSIVPVVLDQNDFKRVYSDLWWYKLKMGTGVYGVFWNKRKLNGLGDIDIQCVDLLNLFWAPGVKNIQQSPHLFNVELVDVDQLEAQYPQLHDSLAQGQGYFDVTQYMYDDTVDVSKKVLVVDWYYKKTVNGRTVLHYCKFCQGKVLFATENVPQLAQRGLYDHGKYPFVFDVLFPVAGSPAGFGYVDICKDAQRYIDRLDGNILKHSIMATTPRFFISGNGELSEKEFADWTKPFIHVPNAANLTEMLQPMQIPVLPNIYESIRQNKIDELKETSGNRDFNQGGTGAGVTAASAIAALQEAGGKISRDNNSTSYASFEEVNYLVIELMRQNYTEPRMFRIAGKNSPHEYQPFDNRRIRPQPQGMDFGIDMGVRMPIFDVRAVAQRSSPFSTVAQNERAKELFQMGFYRPDMADQALAALEMMQFEGIEKVRDNIRKNSLMLAMAQKIMPLMIFIAAELDRVTGSQYTAQVAAVAQQVMSGMQGAPGMAGSDPVVNAVGAVARQTENSSARGARQNVARAAMPKA